MADDPYAAFRAPAQGTDEWAAFRPGGKATPAAAPGASPYPPFVDPNTGLSSADIPDPETTDVITQGIKEGAVGSAAGFLGAVDRPAEKVEEIFQGTSKRRETREQMQEYIRGLAKPSQEQTDAQSRHPLASIAGNVAGGLPVGIATWAGKWPLAALMGFESAEEISKSRGEKPSNLESWRDASLEAMARVLLGKVVDWPGMGRFIKGAIFGGEAGLMSEFEGRPRDQAEVVDIVVNAIMGGLGPDITPGSKARLEAAQEAAKAGDGKGGMYHLREAQQQDDVASFIAKTARERTLDYPEPTGDVTHQAAHQEAGPPRLEGPPDPGLPGPEGGPQLRPPSDPGFRERQERGTEGQLPGPEKQALLGKPRADPEMDLSEPMPEKPPGPPTGPRESVTPAVRSTTGEVFTGPTHAHAMEAAEAAGHEVAEEPGNGSYLTSKGRYVSRDEALLIQNKGEPLPRGAKPWENRKEPPVEPQLDFSKRGPRAYGDPAGQPGPAIAKEPPRPVQPKRPRGPAAKPLEKHSLFEYIITRGGLAPDPELTHIFGRKNPFIPGFGPLIRKNGMPLDRAREAIVEARYLHDPGDVSGGLSETTVPELLEKIAEEARGRKQYRQGFEPPPDAKVDTRDEMQIDHERRQQLEQALEDAGFDSSGLDDSLWNRTCEMMDKEGEQDVLVAFERAAMEEGHALSEQGHVDPIDDFIEGWHVSDDAGPAPQTGRSLATIAQSAGLARRDSSRAISAPDREAADAGGTGAIGGGRGGGRLPPPGAEEGEFRDVGGPRRLEGPPPKGTFPQDRLPRVPTGDKKLARERSQASISGIMARRDRVNAMQKRHWDEGEKLPVGVPDEVRNRVLSNFMHGRDPLAGVEGKTAPPAEPGFTRYSKRNIYVDVPEAEARTLTRDRLNELIDQEGRPLKRGGIGENHAKEIREWFKKSGEVQDIQFQNETIGAKIANEYRENYWYLFYKDPEGAKAAGSGHLGPPDFTKHKVFEDPIEAEAAGFELKNTNWAVMGAARQEAGNMAMTRVFAMEALVEDGLAISQTEATSGKRDASIPKDIRDWAKNVIVGGTNYYVHPVAKMMLERGLHIDQKTLAEMLNFDPTGKIAKGERSVYGAIIKARNATVPMKLAFSAFHALHVAHIAWSQPIAAALHQKLNRRISNTEFIRSIRDIKMLGTYAYGAKAAENWAKPFEELSPIEQVEQNIMIAGGFTPGKPSIYEIGAERALRRQLNDTIPSLHQKLDKDGADLLARAWKTTPQYAKAAGLLLGKGIEAMQGPMFNDWIPAMKTAAYLNQAKLLIEARPDLVGVETRQGANYRGSLEGKQEVLAAADEMRRELQKIRRSIDNRFGEMQYDKEFMNPLIRKGAMGFFLSVGWNWGFLREFGGGFLVDPYNNALTGAKNLFRSDKIQNEISTRTVYAGIYVFGAMLLSGLMTFLMTGQRPQDMKDLVYPRHADDTRSNTMFFTREFLGAYFHMVNEGVGQGAWNLFINKAAPVVQSFWQAMTNRDYFGHQIYDANGNPFQQIGQAMKWYAKQVGEPISFSGLEQQGDDPARIAESFMGFNPAPAYVERSRTVSEIYKAASDLLGGKTAYDEVERANAMREMAQAFRRAEKSQDPKDREAYEALRDKYIEKYPERLGVNAKNLKQSERNWSRPPALGTFARIGTVSPETQIRIFDEAPLSEKAWLQLGLLKRLREGRAFEVTPDMVASFPEADQDNVLKILGPGQRNAYLPYVTPKLQKQYGPQPAQGQPRTGLVVLPSGKGGTFNPDTGQIEAGQ